MMSLDHDKYQLDGRDQKLKKPQCLRQLEWPGRYHFFIARLLSQDTPE